MQKLEAVSDTDPLFAGLIRYEKSIELESSPEKAFFCAEHVYDVMGLNVNGEEAGSCRSRLTGLRFPGCSMKA